MASYYDFEYGAFFHRESFLYDTLYRKKKAKIKIENLGQEKVVFCNAKVMLEWIKLL